MQLYTVKQVAELLNISERSVMRLISQRGLPSVDVCVSDSGKKPRRRIREDDLQAFLDSRQIESRQERLLRHRRRRNRE